MFKFYSAYLVNEIMLRHRKSIHKKELLLFRWPEFHEKEKKEREEFIRDCKKK